MGIFKGLVLYIRKPQRGGISIEKIMMIITELRRSGI